MSDKVKIVFAIVRPNADGYGSDGICHISMELKPSMIPNVGDYISFPDENGNAYYNIFDSYIVKSKRYVYSEDDNKSYMHIHLTDVSFKG